MEKKQRDRHIYVSHQRPVHTSPEELENGVFTLKPYQMFSVHTVTTLEKFKNVMFTLSFNFLDLRFLKTKNSGTEIT